MPAELLHANLSDLVTDVGEDRRDHGLQGLLLVTTGLILQEALLGARNKVVTLCIRLPDHRVFLFGKNGAWDNVVDTERETVVCYDAKS